MECTYWLADYCHRSIWCVHVGWQTIVTVRYGVYVLVGRLLSPFNMECTYWLADYCHHSICFVYVLVGRLLSLLDAVCTCWLAGYCHYLMLCVLVGWQAIVTV